jgi:hypothetical protein
VRRGWSELPAATAAHGTPLNNNNQLNNNQLSGAMSAELGQLGALTVLYLDENQLTGHGQEAFRA